MTVIYLDNAATSWPKPPAVREALARYFGDGGGNPGRSGHRMSVAAARIVEDARDAVAELLGVQDPSRIVFGKNATEALNLAIHGLLRPGDHAITSGVEHNSVMRPLRYLEDRGVEVTVVPCRSDGTLDPTDVRDAIRPETRLIVTLHGSNVTGALLPIGDIAAIARDRGVPYLVDASQTAGSVPIDVEDLDIDLLAFTGHKSLLGPTGTGGLYVRAGIELDPLMQGGTGSRSDAEIQPDFLPDVYESGTLNTAGLVGLEAGIRHVTDVGVPAIAAHERSLVDHFLRGTAEIPGVTVHGPEGSERRCGVLSFTVDGLVPSEVGTLLDRQFDIMCRVGLHCAPGAHRTIGTFPQGSVRFGLSTFSTVEEIDVSLDAIDEIAPVGGGDMSLDGLLTFFASHHAVRADKVLTDGGFESELVPGPKELSPNCGVALRFVYDRQAEALDLLEGANVEVDEVHRYESRTDAFARRGRRRRWGNG